MGMGWLWGCEGIRDKPYQFMLFTQTLAPKLDDQHTTYISAHNPERVQTPQPPPRTAMVSPKAITRCEKHASTCAPPVALCRQLWPVAPMSDRMTDGATKYKYIGHCLGNASCAFPLAAPANSNTRMRIRFRCGSMRCMCAVQT